MFNEDLENDGQAIDAAIEKEYCKACEKNDCARCLLAVTCHYCMQPVGIGKALEVDGVYYHPICHKDMVLEACYFCDNVDRDCPADCGFLAYATQYLEEEEKEWSDES